MTHPLPLRDHPLRNDGIPLDINLVSGLRVNRASADRRAASLTARRSVKKQYQVAWLLNALRMMDLTTLSGDDTPDRVERLCRKALQPLRADLLAALGVPPVRVGAVCVYHEMVPTAVRVLAGSGVPVAAVSTGFPAGLAPFETKLREIELSVAAGAAEIDIVITRRHVFAGDWPALYDEIRAYRAACGEAHLKAILATGDLATLENVAQASWVAMMAGADFIKTSTGKEGVNATLPVSLVMVRAIREYFELTGRRVGFKPAGGISTAKSAIGMLTLIREELGPDWLTPDLFRLGASSLLTDIERQVEHYLTGQYSAAHRHALP
ncbi:MAG: deoxyribose-phosphate aldolase [Aliidongia sp.]